MKVALLVRSLERGGAERQLVMLARGLHRSGIEVVVVVFYDNGPFERDLVEAGVRVVSLGKSGRWDLGAFTLRFLGVMRRERPDILYGFVVTPNLLGSAVKPFFPALRTVWGIRSARMDLSEYDWFTRLLYRLEAQLSSLPDLIIVNSQAGRRHLSKRGFPAERIAYVPNGIDVIRYCSDPAGRARLRREWGLAETGIVVGMVARADPVKAHDVFIDAIKLLRSEPRLSFVCVGVAEPAATKLRARAKEAGVADCLRIEGPRDDMAAVYSALDLHVMCSHSEGFPNVVAEAMACGVPCAVTAVGDAVEIVGDTGEHVPPANPVALAEAIRVLLARVESDSAAMRLAARVRIEQRYSLDALASRTLTELRRIASK